MVQTFFTSDPHFGHKNIIKFTDNNGEIIRKFDSIEEHDEHLVEQWNSVVRDQDRVYLLGDVAMNRRCLPIMERLRGRKVLIKGNHDIFKLKDYAKYFDDIRAYRMYPKYGIVCSHIPVHPNQLEHRFKVNVHGHLHKNLVIKDEVIGYDDMDIEIYDYVPDERYVNVCVEHTNYTPISFDELLERCNMEKIE
jgi:calcineurin-like phosphoesterase family protein